MSSFWQVLCERISSGAWLESRIVRFAAICSIVGTAICMAFLFATATGTLDLLGRPLGTDFSSFWTAGSMALDHNAADAYVWEHHRAMQIRTHGNEKFFPWSYPPTFLMVAAVLALLPYVQALVVWQGVTALTALVVFRSILPSGQALLLAVGFPAVMICLGHGQTGFLTAALLAGGVVLLQRFEIWAGVLFGLAAYKPQFGLLLPIVLIAGGYWRAIASAAATVLAVAGLTVILWGWPVWQAFLDSASLTRTIVFEGGHTGWEKFQSAFSWVRMWGGSVPLAYTAQAVVAAASILACAWIWHGRASHNLKGAALLSGALLFSPYVLDYDFIVFGMALAFFTAHGLETGFRAGDKTFIAFAWFVPGVARTVAGYTLLPLGFLTLASFFVWVIVRSWAEERTMVVTPLSAQKAAGVPGRGSAEVVNP